MSTERENIVNDLLSILKLTWERGELEAKKTLKDLAKDLRREKELIQEEIEIIKSELK